MIKVKAAVAAANAEIYERIFRLAELKGLVATLAGLDTKAGVFHEGGRFGEPGWEVEYVAQLAKADADKLAAELKEEIQALQNALDEFNLLRQLSEHRALSVSASPTTGRVAATTMMTKTNSGSVKLRLPERSGFKGVSDNLHLRPSAKSAVKNVDHPEPWPSQMAPLQAAPGAVTLKRI